MGLVGMNDSNLGRTTIYSKTVNDSNVTRSSPGWRTGVTLQNTSSSEDFLARRHPADSHLYSTV